MENKEFLENLKINDKILIQSSSWRSTEYFIDTIVKITPTRQIKTEKGCTFKNGYQRDNSTGGTNYYIIEKNEENMKKYISLKNKKELYSFIRNTNVEKLNDEKIKKLLEAFKND